MADLRRLLNPKTVALIGATDREDSIGLFTLENLLLSPDRKVYPVNPKRDRVLDVQCYPEVGDIPDQIDLAIVAIPAGTVPQVVDRCGQKGVGGIIIVSAGFRDAGPDGMALEKEVASIREKYGMPIIGPNCMGVIRPHLNLNASFLKASPEKGKIAFISQSGAFGRALLDWGMSVHIGFSMFASLGSMIDVEFADLIDFLSEDPQTRSIMIYVEGSIGDV
jgi:acetyltransferase